MHADETSIKNSQTNSGLDTVFCRLLQVALGIIHDFPYNPSEGDWQSLFQMAKQQCVLGVAYNAIPLLPQGSRPPRRITLNWSGAAETMRGANRLINQEAAHYTSLFAEHGLRSAILKGAANARLYPDPLSRQAGDIDIWVPGGYDTVEKLLLDMGAISEGKILDKVKHHIAFTSENNIRIEVHHRPVKRLYSNKKAQNVLITELENLTLTPEGFYSPSIRFALIMQLEHLYSHCVDGVGLKQYMDYFVLLMHSTGDDRTFAWQLVQKFRLVHACAAIMWVLEKVFALPRGLMLCAPDEKRGMRLYNLAFTGGNFGKYDLSRGKNRFVITRWLNDRKRVLSWFGFDPTYTIVREIQYWKETLSLIPERIKRRKIGL